jgi:hypothetical protein
MNNTPETDENTWSDSCEGVMHEVVNASFARRMEIERNKWRDCATKLVESSGWHDQWPQAVAHYRKLKEELK